MSKETKSILFLLSCIFGLIFCFIVVSLNYKEEDESAKKERVVEAEDIGIEEVEEEKEVEEKKETTNSTSNENNTKSISEPKKEESKEKSEAKEKVEEESKEVDEEPKEEKEESNLVSLGKFKLTAYCSCSKCCGKWAGSPMASGVMPKANHTIAVDTSVIPFGTKVMINGKTYVAEDTGSAIKGNKIDVFFDSHSKALNFGVRYAEVFVVK